MSKQTYVVRKGHTFGAGNRLSEGDTAKLTEREAGGFLDKLQLASEAKEANSQPSEQSTVDDLTTLTGLGPSIAKELANANIETFADLAAASDEVLMAVQGVTAEKVASWKTTISQSDPETNNE